MKKFKAVTSILVFMAILGTTALLVAADTYCSEYAPTPPPDELVDGYNYVILDDYDAVTCDYEYSYVVQDDYASVVYPNFDYTANVDTEFGYIEIEESRHALFSIVITQTWHVSYRIISDDFANPDWDWCYRQIPLGFSPSAHYSASISFGPSLSSDTLSSLLGFDVTKSLSCCVTIRVPPRSITHISVYMHFFSYAFNIYFDGTLTGSGTASRPHIS